MRTLRTCPTRGIIALLIVFGAEVGIATAAQAGGFYTKTPPMLAGNFSGCSVNALYTTKDLPVRVHLERVGDTELWSDFPTLNYLNGGDYIRISPTAGGADKVYCVFNSETVSRSVGRKELHMGAFVANALGVTTAFVEARVE